MREARLKLYRAMKRARQPSVERLTVPIPVHEALKTQNKAIKKGNYLVERKEERVAGVALKKPEEALKEDKKMEEATAIIAPVVALKKPEEALKEDKKMEEATAIIAPVVALKKPEEALKEDKKPEELPHKQTREEHILAVKAAKNIEESSAGENFVCDGSVDPFASFKSIEAFTPPQKAPIDVKNSWKRKVRDLVNQVAGMKTGGKELRNLLREEVDRLKTERYNMFCKYYLK